MGMDNGLKTVLARNTNTCCAGCPADDSSWSPTACSMSRLQLPRSTYPESAPVFLLKTSPDLSFISSMGRAQWWLLPEARTEIAWWIPAVHCYVVLPSGYIQIVCALKVDGSFYSGVQLSVLYQTDTSSWGQIRSQGDATSFVAYPLYCCSTFADPKICVVANLVGKHLVQSGWLLSQHAIYQLSHCLEGEQPRLQ